MQLKISGFIVAVFSCCILFAHASSCKHHSPPKDCKKVKTCGNVPAPSNTGHKTPHPILHSSKVWSFVSAPKLHPMKITVNVLHPGTAPGFILVAPYAFSDDAMYGQSGALMMDNLGNPVWFRPLSTPNLMNTDFRVQQLRGESVLTFWQGTLATTPTYTNVPGGSSEPGSCYYILDSSYRVLTTVTAHRGYTADIHEFLLTPSNTALFLATKAVPMDLTPYGGPKNGFVQDFAIQEVDLHTHQLLFFWNALDHVPLTDSFQPASSATESGNIWDAYHFNSIGLTDSMDDIIASGRNTWTIYRIHKPSGNILWRLGGKQSSFTFNIGAEFSWQHDARFLSGSATQSTVSMFDDNCCESDTVPPGTPPSHGLVLQLDLNAMTASLVTSYYHDPLITVSSQGNVQTLPNTNKFVGWGQSKYFSEFAAPGNTAANPSLNLLYDAQMPGNNYTYRAYRNPWVGTPHYPPAIAVKSCHEKIHAYASWNGSTETASWQLFAGKHSQSLCLVACKPKSSFETTLTTSNKGPWFQVKALNSNGKVIGESPIVKLKK